MKLNVNYSSDSDQSSDSKNQSEATKIAAPNDITNSLKKNVSIKKDDKTIQSFHGTSKSRVSQS